MATTHLKAHHISKGMTIEKSLAERFDYGQNPDKTQGGELIAAYMCDHQTADAEFLLNKAKYKAITGREQKRDADVLCYQIRQSFLPGEIDAEAALRIGYDTAMRWTKGKHAFFVATHTDRAHIHNHIYYDATSLDCTQKYRNFWGSTFALRRLSDRVCIENNLSYIKEPKLHSKGQFKHYGQWLGINKPLTFQEQLKRQIDACLAQHPDSFDDFLSVMEAAGYEIKHGRGGAISFRAEGQERFTRLRSSTLGECYGQNEIKAAIAGKTPHLQSRASTGKVNLVVDIDACMRSGKGPAYERWAKVFNLKQMAATLQYLQKNNLLEYKELAEKAAAATDRFNTLSWQIKGIENDLNKTSALMGATVDYAKTRPIFDEYKATKYSRKYLAEHEEELKIYRTAQSTLYNTLNGGKLPKMESLKQEYQKLAAEKNTAYKEYKEAKREMKEAVTAKANIDHLFEITSTKKTKEVER